VTIEAEFSLDQPRQINHLAPGGVLAKDTHLKFFSVGFRSAVSVKSSTLSFLNPSGTNQARIGTDELGL
jgi:hypothetical protein